MSPVTLSLKIATHFFLPDPLVYDGVSPYQAWSQTVQSSEDVVHQPTLSLTQVKDNNNKNGNGGLVNRTKKKTLRSRGVWAVSWYNASTRIMLTMFMHILHSS